MKETNIQPYEKVIPILPCVDIKVHAAFYEALGFEILGLYTSPSEYLSIKWRSIELGFWGSVNDPSKNSSICFMFVHDVNDVNRQFTEALKKLYGKIPRAGFPKITKVRNLVYDR